MTHPEIERLVNIYIGDLDITFADHVRVDDATKDLARIELTYHENCFEDTNI